VTENVINELPEEALKHLSHVGKTVVVATVDAAGWPNTAPLTWVVAKDKQTIRMAVNAAASTLQNIHASGRVAIFIGNDAIAISVKGRARVLKEPMHSVPFPTALIEVVVEAVEDKMALPPGIGSAEVPTWDQRRRVVSDAAVEQELLS